MKLNSYNKNYICDEYNSNQSYSFGKNDNSNQNNNESNDELDSNKNNHNHENDCSDIESDDSDDESSDNSDSSDNSNDNFDDNQNNKKWKRIKVDNICSQVEGVFTKSELKKFGEEYDIYIKDIRCENKEEILKDENNTDYKWKSTVGHAIIKFVKRRPKMATQSVRYVTHDEFKVFADNVTNTLNTIVNSINVLSNRVDSMEERLEKKIDQKIDEVKTELRKEIQDVKRELNQKIDDTKEELKKEIDEIKQCPTIKKELSELNNN